MSGTTVDIATNPVASSETVAPVDAPHLTGELPASTTGPVDTTAGAADPDTPAGDDPPKTRDRAAERRIAKLTQKYEDAQREIGRLRGLAEARASGQPTTTSEPVRPQRAQFASDEDFTEALTDWKVDQKLTAREQETAKRSRGEALAQAEDAAAKTVVEKIAEDGKDIEGFDEVMETITATDFPEKGAALTRTMRDFLGESEHPALLAKGMADDPKEAARIAKLDPAVAVKALERWEGRLAAKPPVRTTKAPPPPPTVSGRSTPQVDLSKITDMEEYAKARGYSR